jgi:hypothetical protein
LKGRENPQHPFFAVSHRDRIDEETQTGMFPRVFFLSFKERRFAIADLNKTAVSNRRSLFFYSLCNARAGSTVVARHAGITVATAADPISTLNTASIVTGSTLLTP